LMEFCCDKVESSVQKIIESPIVKNVDTTIHFINDKFNVDEKGCKVLDVVEEKTEKLLESSKSYYNQGKNIVEHTPEKVLELYFWGTELKDQFIEKGQEIYETKKDQVLSLYTNTKTTLDEKKNEINDEYQNRSQEYKKKKDEIKKKGEDILSSGKEAALSLYSKTKEDYFDKPQKFIVELLFSKYETLKYKYPNSVKKVDELYEVGKTVAEGQKEKAVEFYSKTCKYYEHQKEAVKLKSLDYLNKGTHIIQQGTQYLLNNISGDQKEIEEKEKNSEEKPGNEKEEVNEKNGIAGLGKKYLFNIASRYYDAIKSKLSSANPAEPIENLNLAMETK